MSRESAYIQAGLYANSTKSVERDTSVVYYDCTNYFFEIEEADGFRKYGVSKEHRPNPIVQLGLFMDRDGLPLSFCINPGNTAETQTMTPLEDTMERDFGVSCFIVCTDAGLASAENRMANSKNGRGYITAASIKKMKEFMQEWALQQDDPPRCKPMWASIRRCHQHRYVSSTTAGQSLSSGRQVLQWVLTADMSMSMLCSIMSITTVRK